MTLNQRQDAMETKMKELIEKMPEVWRARGDGAYVVGEDTDGTVLLLVNIYDYLEELEDMTDEELLELIKEERVMYMEGM